MQKKLTFLGLILILILLPGFGLKCVDKETEEKMMPITLNYWRVWDGPDAFQGIIDSYRSLHPFVTINYKKLRYDEYEDALLEAYATDKEPDIFSIHNTWIQKYKDKGFIEAMPETITMAYPIVRGKLKKEVIPELKTTRSITLKDLRNNFLDVVYEDVVVENKVYGLPLSVDTLAMFYNRDLFNNAGIIDPPKYWNQEFQQTVKKLTKQNNKGQIIQSGIAMGGSDNIERSTDILSVIMMQNGTEMMDEKGIVKFHVVPAQFDDGKFFPGVDALRFYTDFANPAKEVYSWNKNLENATDLFAQNRLAIMFGYAYMLPEINSKAPKLNYGIAPLPQIEGNPKNVNFANYWVEVVSKKILSDTENLKLGSAYAKQKFDTAWNFIQFATEKSQADKYLAQTNKPPALRALIEEKIENQELGVFSEQLLTAKSWYKGHNAIAAENYMKEMIDAAVLGQTNLSSLVNVTAQKVQQTVY